MLLFIVLAAARGAPADVAPCDDLIFRAPPAARAARPAATARRCSRSPAGGAPRVVTAAATGQGRGARLRTRCARRRSRCASRTRRRGGADVEVSWLTRLNATAARPRRAAVAAPRRFDFFGDPRAPLPVPRECWYRRVLHLVRHPSASPRRCSTTRASPPRPRRASRTARCGDHRRVDARGGRRRRRSSSRRPRRRRPRRRRGGAAASCGCERGGKGGSAARRRGPRASGGPGSSARWCTGSRGTRAPSVGRARVEDAFVRRRCARSCSPRPRRAADDADDDGCTAGAAGAAAARARPPRRRACARRLRATGGCGLRARPRAARRARTEARG